MAKEKRVLGHAGKRPKNPGWKEEKMKQRRSDAKNRQESYDALMVSEKIARVLERPGESKKELTRLYEKLEKETKNA